MWAQNWRDELWERLRSTDRPWDMLVIGGGITGAGILQQAARSGLRVLLVEQRDFGWGTSSRSSKMVHGGLRYLKTGDVRLTYESVRERERLLCAGPGLVDELGFLIVNYRGDRPGRFIYNVGLTVYDLLALNLSHRAYSPDQIRMLVPRLAPDGLQGGFRYADALTDDARLTLRVIQEGLQAGGMALNYAAAETLIREQGRVVGAVVHDQVGDRTVEVRARVVVNAAGAMVDRLRAQVGGTTRIRPLRGSHLVFAAWRCPVAQAVTILHPLDRRPVYVYPWEGVTVVGTTDVDHDSPLSEEPAISPAEVAYLMAAVHDLFPGLNLTLDDVISTWAGVRPVIDTGKADPSKESREHAIWEENGLLTVTGGKLTTFRLMALDVLRSARHLLPDIPLPDAGAPPLQPISATLIDPRLTATQCARLLGRYADAAPRLVEAAQPGELTPIPGTQTLWAELRWAARAEGVVHLDDLLLRRVRIGTLLPGGGESLLPRIRAVCRPELGWDDVRWEAEVAAYLALWRKAYSLPPRELIPDWRPALAEAQAKRAPRRAKRRGGRNLMIGRGVVLVAVSGLALWSASRLARRRMCDGHGQAT